MSGNLFSHLYQLALPPLFPLIRAETGLSYTSLGTLLGVLYVTSGLMQTPAGFLVDRIGARSVLICGLTLVACAIALFGLAPSYPAMIALAALGGVGNSVFHPANYAIMSATVSPERMGRAFSIHTVGGHIGYAIAPAVMVMLSIPLGWRSALIVVGISGLAVAALMLASLEVATDDPSDKPAETSGLGGVRTLMQPPIILLLVFFILLAMGLIGFQSFTPTVLNTVRGLNLTLANTALAGFLFGAPIGVFAGGFLADRVRRHNLVTVCGILVSAVLIGATGLLNLPVTTTMALFFVAGLSFGIAMPARDMVVRSIAPPGASGKVFGFVYSGLDTGAAISPVLFGWLVDIGHAMWIFAFVSLFMVSAASTILLSQRLARQTPMQAREQPS